MDTFETVKNLTPGSFVTVSLAGNAHVAGVVARVDAEGRELHFTNGVSVTFPPETDTVAEGDDEKETDDAG